VKRLRTLRVTPRFAALFVVVLTLLGGAAGWGVQQGQDPEYQVSTDVLVHFWSIESYLLNGQIDTVTSLDVADAATLGSSLDVLDAAAGQLHDGRDGADLSKAVTVTAQTTSNSVTIVATDPDPRTAESISQAVATAIIAEVQQRVATAEASLADAAQGDFTTGVQQRARALTTTVKPLEALASGPAEQTSPNSKTALAMAVVGLAAAALILVGLIFGRPLVNTAREGQRLLEVPTVPFTGGEDPQAARLVRRLLDDRPTGPVLLVPVDDPADKAADEFLSWVRNHCATPAEADRLITAPEPAGVVLRPRPTADDVAAVLLVVTAGTHRRDVIDAAALLRTWRAADAAVLATERS
jgi:capsular polysaccharide biosynthesis protein